MRIRTHRPTDPESLRASDSVLEIDRGVLSQGIDWSALFGTEQPVELEIGCGKGMFLALAAAAHPEVNWFGIDHSSAHLRRAIDRALKARLTNALFSKARAEDLLGEWIPDASLRGVHLLYPDPWPKKRHHKRRLLGLHRGPETMRLLARVIQPGGWLSVATDHTGYADAIGPVGDASPDFERSETFYSQTLMPDPEEPLTEFERKYRLEGRPRHCFSWQRR
jgi:tRNA (guanine-N7-)-methyltransferase